MNFIGFKLDMSSKYCYRYAVWNSKFKNEFYWIQNRHELEILLEVFSMKF